MPVIPVRGPWASKDLQHMVAAGELLNVAGHRRICISDRCHNGNPESRRGIVEVWQQDTWPASDAPGTFTKDKRRGPGLEDMRDAWLYYSVIAHPPNDIGRAQAPVRSAEQWT